MHNQFEWDELKNARNKAKHSISFETAALVFDDIDHKSILAGHKDGEERWQTLGMVGGVLVLLVVHTYRANDTDVDTIRYESFQQEKRLNLKGDIMKKLTKTQTAEIQALASLPDSAIDTTEIPELTKQQLTSAYVGRFYKPIKKPVTMRLDADVLEWFKTHYDKYQTNVNQILREHMKSHS